MWFAAQRYSDKLKGLRSSITESYSAYKGKKSEFEENIANRKNSTDQNNSVSTFTAIASFKHDGTGYSLQRVKLCKFVTVK